jgi:hypothetical protein
MRDAVDAAASGAHGNCRAGEQPVSDQAARGRTALNRCRESFGGLVPGPPAGFCGDARGRRSRVVLAPVAGVKFVGGGAARPGAATPSNQRTTVARRNSSPGRARRKPLKPLRREGRMIRLYLWFCRVLLLHADHGCERHPAFPAPSVFRGTRFLQSSGAMRGENADVCRSFVRASMQSRALSFRDGPQDQTRNLEIPGSMLRIAPE